MRKSMFIRYAGVVIMWVLFYQVAQWEGFFDPIYHWEFYGMWGATTLAIWDA